ncbi:NADP-dependent oxidoreductase [Pelotalea chapellei]|uniref:NADP-dependent oxidoreductase n=1 Tax=Pelotalea chapellei TaxID=44671 RepID=A0ABS5U633_9BACT|nr:NADP-dependent oxidoreductase [Pelotalea chapellei]MBT1071130.1 NADP-dependent oxidoreductase [Pelotalea chapellei]
MKAIVFEQYGGPDVLELREVPRPFLRANDVLIEVHAASVNPVDWKIRAGHLREMIHYDLPVIPGWDAAGVVVDAGPEVERFKKGDAVFSRTDIARNGTYAEYVAVDEKYVALKPSVLSYEEAASIPLVGLTAWQALVDYAGIKKGDRVLIHAGAGGVGAFGIQLAKDFCCYVTTTCSTPNVEFVRSLGADHVIDYTKSDFSTELQDFDVVFDTEGGEIYKKSFKVLKRQQGVIVSILEQPDHDLADRARVRAGYLFMHPDGMELANIGELIERGLIKPTVENVFPLAEARKAHELSESGHARGKIVIKVR